MLIYYWAEKLSSVYKYTFFEGLMLFFSKENKENIEILKGKIKKWHNERNALLQTGLEDDKSIENKSFVLFGTITSKLNNKSLVRKK